MFLFWSASSVVSIVALAMCSNESGARGASEGALKGGMYVWLLSSNINNLSLESLTPPLTALTSAAAASHELKMTMMG